MRTTARKNAARIIRTTGTGTSVLSVFTFSTISTSECPNSPGALRRVCETRMAPPAVWGRRTRRLSTAEPHLLGIEIGPTSHAHGLLRPSTVVTVLSIYFPSYAWHSPCQVIEKLATFLIWVFFWHKNRSPLSPKPPFPMQIRAAKTRNIHLQYL